LFGGLSRVSRLSPFQGGGEKGSFLGLGLLDINS
jgi:hypothetical protein